MFVKRLFIAVLALVFVFGAVVMMAGTETVAKEKAIHTKLCLNCHKPEPGSMLARFDNVAFKTESLQMTIDAATEIIRFDSDDLKVMIRGKAEEADALRQISRGHEIRVEFTEKDGVRFATRVTSKPPISVPEEKLISTQELMKLVAMGPEKGGYFLVDSRPAPRYDEAHIPTAVSIPDTALPAQAARLPINKDILLIFYCGGVT